MIQRDACRCSITLGAISRVKIYNSLFFLCMSFYCVTNCFAKYEHKIRMCVIQIKNFLPHPNVPSMFNQKNETQHWIFIISWCGSNFASSASFWYDLPIKFNEQWQIWLSVNWLIMDACFAWISFQSPWTFCTIKIYTHTVNVVSMCEWRQINSLSSVIVWCGKDVIKSTKCFCTKSIFTLMKWKMKRVYVY